MHKRWLFLVGLLANLSAAAQIGGTQTFRFLQLPNNAKLAGLGSINVSAGGSDASVLYTNPALLQPGHHQQLAFSFVDFAADISQNTLTYAFAPKQRGVWGVGLTYLNYGDFTQRDASGQEEGTFAVQDYALSVTHATTLKPFTLAASVKLAVSGIAEYKAVGVLADLGGVFKHPEKDFTVGLAFKNIGYQVLAFSGQARQPAPFDAQIGVTYKPEHMPFRFSLTAHHLQQFDIVYLDTTGTSSGLGGQTPDKKTVGDKILRHFVAGGEILLSKNLQVRAGYNHLRNRELRQEGASGAAGFSLGTMLRIRSFELDYAHAFYHKAGGANYITVNTNLNRLFKTKAKPAN